MDKIFAQYTSNNLREKIIAPTLDKLGLISESAINLLLGTCAQESHMGRYRVQLGCGIAQSIYQIEPTTHSLVIDYINKYHKDKCYIINNILVHCCEQMYDYIDDYEWPECIDMKIGDLLLRYNDAYSTIIARMLYYSIPEPLPKPNDIEGMAGYWKKYYNRGGRGTVEEFIINYKKFVL